MGGGVAIPRLRASLLPPLLLVLLAGGWYGCAAAQPAPAASLSDHPRGAAGPWRTRGQLMTTPRPAGDAWRVDLRVDQIHVNDAWRSSGVRVRATVYDPSGRKPWVAGQRFEAFLALRPQRAARNPLVGERAPLTTDGVDVRASLKSFRQLRPLSPPARVVVAIARARAGVRTAIARRFPRRAPLMQALLLGERDAVPSPINNALARTGLVHLFAISGLHVGIVVTALFALLRSVSLPRPRAALIAGGALPLLYALVVPRPPVARACWMAATLLAGLATGRRTSAINGLALATLLLSAMDPWVTRNFGFQLSTAATAAIVALGPPRSPPRRGPLGWGLTLLRVSAVAQLAVAPLLVPTTFRLPLAAVASNVVAVPLLSTIVIAGMLTVAADLSHLEVPAAGLALLGESALSALQRIMEIIDARSTALTVPAASAPWVGTAAVAMLGALYASLPGPGRATMPRTRRRGATVAATLIALLALSIGAAKGTAEPPPADYRLVAFDVGQGDAFLLESGDKALLVDSGGSLFGSFDPGAALIAPALRARGIGALDAVLISHLHADHFGGLVGLLGDMDSAAVWAGPFDAATAAGRRFESARREVPTRTLVRGDQLRLGECRGDVLHPPASSTDAALSNDGSVVVALRCGSRAVLLTGDSERAAEAAYAPLLRVPRGTVLKSPHHGSRTSSGEAVLAAVAPRHVVISVGWRNRFGLPDAEILERYRARRIAVYRTDRDGAVTLTAGARLRVTGERWTAGRGRHHVGGWLY